MKPFTLIMAEVDDGKTAAALSADLQELITQVRQAGRSGSLSLKLKVAPAVRNESGAVNQVTLTIERKLELPKPSAPTDFFWLTDDDQLSRNHPKQQSLQLHDVAGSGTVNSADLKQAT